MSAPDRQPRNVGDLAASPTNPRTAAAADLQTLAASMARYGDLGGIVFNRRSGQLIGGHQRLKSLPAAEQIHIEHRLRRPNPQGTVALGWVELDGERFSYRLVDVDARTEREMNLRANQPAGRWDEAKLGAMLRQLQREGTELGTLGFDEAQLRALLAPPLGPGEAADAARATLAERFLVPPFSVLDARQGYWKTRKAAWLALGIQSEVGRGDNLLKMSDTILEPDPAKRALKASRPRSESRVRNEKSILKRTGSYTPGAGPKEAARAS